MERMCVAVIMVILCYSSDTAKNHYGYRSLKTDQLLLRAKAFNYLFDAVVVTDEQGIIIDWNKGSESLYGYTKAEAIGQPVSILHVPEDIDQITSKVLASVAKTGKWIDEVRMQHKDGSVGWIESMCIPILTDSGDMIGALGINRDITKRIHEIEQLRHLAQYDHLTQIPNRFLLLDRISHLINQYERNKMAFTLLFFDLDHFKKINDNHGHIFGDKILKEVADRVSACIRKSDMAARIGGDEFVILLENIFRESDIFQIIKTVNTSLSEDINIDKVCLNIRCSIGFSTYPINGSNADELLLHADKLMYQDKKSR
jgi:diguanylate cyclase (GGDEF)-like protein/PAS domain S-box-containing protein